MASSMASAFFMVGAPVSNGVHLVGQVVVERSSVLGHGDDSLSKDQQVVEILLGDVLTHRDLGVVNDGLGQAGVVVQQGGQVVELFVCEGGLVFNEQSQLGESVVVWN
ncbi:hypothetical protein WICPIJ_002090 [Wickerhamomyces pijperi]|uniref:Uncharacterized protein n=1 Tax=Wickerhamomyces pijperi TaxID=599730 RepID=A0A9P8TQ68_WICPI|nr:hypothetical protein WICPIJ_002090 [Wickerhamomyces pijperi]